MLSDQSKDNQTKVAHTNLGHLRIEMEGPLDLVTGIGHKNVVEICKSGTNEHL
jgi:hypothetical protein